MLSPSSCVAVPPRLLTELDHARIAALLRRQGVAHGPLVALLDGADLVPGRAVPPDVVTMYSQVLLAQASDVTPRRVTVCYPGDADPAAGLVSVLSPVGSGLLGLPVGALAGWTMPDGREAQAQVLDILYQPEASGDYER